MASSSIPSILRVICVMVVSGSSSRQTAVTEGKPVDLSIVAIIDSVDVNGSRIFEKFSRG